MKTRYAILGSGRQGTSAAYDIACFGDADEILLFDLDLSAAVSSAHKINSLLKTQIATGLQLDVCDPQNLRQALKGINATVSAVPYFYNLEISASLFYDFF